MSPQALLDELQAAEAAGAEALGQWLDSCHDPALRGGLRVIQARDAAHARLAQRRLAALDAVPRHEISRSLSQLCGMLAAPDVSNRSKLTVLLSRSPAEEQDRITALVHELDDDETRALLETIRDDDRASVRWLHEAGEALVTGDETEHPSAPPSLLRFLDAYRAAEVAGAEVVGAWRIVCALPGLRGGLDTIAEREATHAALLTERLRELGGTVRGELRRDVLDAARRRFGTREASDEEKLATVLARHPDDDLAMQPVRDVADALDTDPETREMLRLIASGEAATFAWLRSYRRAVAEQPRGVSLRVLDGGR
ncbi:MAG: hypothetical protein ACREQL_14595 [Candidatus Binatia bacterium]